MKSKNLLPLTRSPFRRRPLPSLRNGTIPRCDAVRAILPLTVVHTTTDLAAGGYLEITILNQNVRSTSIVLAGMRTRTVVASTDLIVSVRAVADGQFVLRFTNGGSADIPQATAGNVVYFAVL